MEHESHQNKYSLNTILLAVAITLLAINLIATLTVAFKLPGISAALGNSAALNEGNTYGVQEVGELYAAKPTEINEDDDPVLGNPNAPVTIVEFSDFECPYCGRFHQQTFPQLFEEYIKTGKVKFVFRDFPLGFHQFAQKASEASECADEQGKYWEYHSTIFQNQASLSLENLKLWAKQLGLNEGKFNSCLDSGAMAAEVQNDMTEGSQFGVTGTPAFFINGKSISGAQPFDVFKQMIDAELA